MGRKDSNQTNKGTNIFYFSSLPPTKDKQSAGPNKPSVQQYRAFLNKVIDKVADNLIDRGLIQNLSPSSSASTIVRHQVQRPSTIEVLHNQAPSLIERRVIQKPRVRAYTSTYNLSVSVNFGNLRSPATEMIYKQLGEF